MHQEQKILLEMMIHKDEIWLECRRLLAELRVMVKTEAKLYLWNPAMLRCCPIEGTHSVILYPRVKQEQVGGRSPQTSQPLGKTTKGPPSSFMW